MKSWTTLLRMPNFYPRSPCGERPVKDATARSNAHFYPRSPCGERQFCGCQRGPGIAFLSTLSLRRATPKYLKRALAQSISIHALLAESDPRQTRHCKKLRFLSTLSLRRATDVIAVMTDAQSISIHALLAESDSKPRALKSRRCVFLSTLSLRRATARRD